MSELRREKEVCLMACEEARSGVFLCCVVQVNLDIRILPVDVEGVGSSIIFGGTTIDRPFASSENV